MLRRCEKSDLPGWMFAWGTRGPQDSAVSTQGLVAIYLPGEAWVGQWAGLWKVRLCWIVVCGG